MHCLVKMHSSQTIPATGLISTKYGGKHLIKLHNKINLKKKKHSEQKGHFPMQRFTRFLFKMAKIQMDKKKQCPIEPWQCESPQAMSLPKSFNSKHWLPLQHNITTYCMRGSVSDQKTLLTSFTFFLLPPLLCRCEIFYLVL